MKKALKTTGSVIGAIALFVICSFIAMLPTNLICAHLGIPMDSGFNSTLSTFIGDFIYIAIAMLIIKFGKKNNVKETITAKGFSPAVLLIVIPLAIAFKYMTVSGIALMPIPEEFITATAKSAADLYTVPVWVQVIGGSLLAPIAEEILYRGFIQTKVSKAFNPIAGIVVTSIIFGASHCGSLLWAVWAGLTAFVLSYIRYKTGSIVPCIVFHCVTNLIADLAANNVISFPSNLAASLIITSIISVIGFIALNKLSLAKNGNSVKVIEAEV